MRKMCSHQMMKTKGRTGQKFRTLDVELEHFQPTERQPVLLHLLVHSYQSAARKTLNPLRLEGLAYSAMCWTVRDTRCLKPCLLRAQSLGLCYIDP